MIPDSQRLAIGKHLGLDATRWHFKWKQNGKWVWSPEYSTREQAKSECEHKVAPWGDKYRAPEQYEEPRVLPDYLGSLDAIMPVCRSIDPSKRDELMVTLFHIVRRNRLHRKESGWWVSVATAAQWSEAYLKTIGKWEDS